MQLLRMAGLALLAAAAGFAPTGAGAFDTAAVTADKPLSSFDRVYIAPVNVALDLRRANSRYGGDRPVSDKVAAEKARDFQEDLTDAFGNSFALAPEPGPGVLTVEASLTWLQSTRPTADDLSDRPGLSLASVYAGGAAMSVVLSEAGAPLAELSDRYVSTFSDGTLHIGVWQDADRAFSRWARQLVSFIEEN